MNRLLKILLISAGCAALILALIYLPEIQVTLAKRAEPLSQINTQERDLSEAQSLLQLKRPLEAAALIKTYQAEIERQTASGKKWLELLVQASEAIPDPAQLVLIFQYQPEALKGHEGAALMVARNLLAHGDWKNYQILRELFIDSAAWFVLDADSLVLQGKADQAVEWLKSRYYDSNQDTPRLLRLALLHFNEHPKYAWAYLDQASKKDPDNSDIHLYRARLLETSGKKELAQAEYKEVSRLNHGDLQAKQELVDFYLREQEYQKARESLAKELKSQTDDTTWIKAFFLAKVVEPLPYSFKQNPPLDGRKTQLVKILAALPDGAFWSQDDTPAADQAVFWLQVLQKLKNNKEGDALVLLENRPFSEEFWDPELAYTLQSVIAYRLSQEMPKHIALLEKKGHGSFAHLLDTLAGPNAYATVFLARGWNEAALQFHTLAVLPEGTPEWIAPALTAALRQNRGVKEALSFAKMQAKSPALNFAIAKLYFENGQEGEGEEMLRGLSLESHDIGKKAAWHYAQLAYQKGEIEKVQDILRFQPDLQKSVAGQELLAKVALKAGKPEEAAAIYSDIEASSLEAKSYLAKKAFADKDFHKAFQLTEILLKANPNSPILKENLNKILIELEKN